MSVKADAVAEGKGAGMALEGYLDLVTSVRIAGWAWDRVYPDRHVTVEILIDGKGLVQRSAREYRSDLEDAGIGDGTHGFSYEPVTPIDPEELFLISAVIVQNGERFYLMKYPSRLRRRSAEDLPSLISIGDHAIGDVITAFPALYQLATQVPLRLWLQHRQIATLWAGPPVEMLPAPPSEGWALDIHFPERFFVASGLHMIQAWFWNLGLPVPSFLPRIPLSGGIGDPIDVIISPFSASGRILEDPNKTWPFDRWNRVIDALLGAGLSVAICGVFTEGRDPRSHDERFWGGRPVQVLDSMPLIEIAGYLRAARCVVTVDNGIGHLAHLLGSPHAQIIPAHPDRPASWVANHNPNAAWIYEPFVARLNGSDALLPERVLELIFAVLIRHSPDSGSSHPS